jgi:hypothetical protein
VQRFAEFARGRQPPGLLRQLVAALTYDSSLQPAAAGLRGADAQGPQRQLVYSCELADIALNIHRHHNQQRLNLAGQVLARAELAPDRLIVQLAQGDAAPDVAVTDELGEFAFEALPPGSYQLTLLAERVQIALAPLELQLSLDPSDMK